RFPMGDVVWLDRRNDIRSLSERAPAAGDIVLLGVGGDGNFVVHGLRGARVTLSPQGSETWPPARWLHEALTDPASRRYVTSQLGGSIPVTVDAVVDHTGGVDAAGIELTVSRRHQPPGWWPRNRLVCTKVAAALTGGTLVVRAGAALHRVTIDEIIP